MGKIRAVVVDDDLYTVKAIKLFLEKLDVSVEGFTNPIEAYESIKKNRQELIITDNSMPNIDGVELAERILDIYNPVMVLVSVVCDQIQSFYNVDLLFDYIFQKPLEYEEFRHEMAKIIKDIEAYKIVNSIEIKDKLFLKNVASILFDQQDDVGLYTKISEEMQKDKSTIRKRLNRISASVGETPRDLIAKFIELQENDKGKKDEEVKKEIK